MANIRRKSDGIVTSATAKDIYNPFPDPPRDNVYGLQAAKPPKVTKGLGKCLQLVLICMKLLKPLNLTAKDSHESITKEKLKFPTNGNQHICNVSSHSTAQPLGKVDTGVQTNAEPLSCIGMSVFDDYDGPLHGSEDFPYDIDESVKEPYWDLDIDSAIVGDFNSMSGLSLEEPQDPHYATIRLCASGRYEDKARTVPAQIFGSTVYPGNEISCSNNSSPKSGIYSKIMKPKKVDFFQDQINDYYRLKSEARLNFQSIMAIRNQLGLYRDRGTQLDPSSDWSTVTVDQMSDTPDIPRRNYGSSVINYITKLRQRDQFPSSCTSKSILNIDKELSMGNVYSPIWTADRHEYDQIASELYEIPSSEPVVPKRSINKILHQLNHTYRDDSSTDTSSISFTAPSTFKYSYPKNFYENLSRKSSFGSLRKSYVNILSDEIDRFRHMDSEVDVSGALVYKDLQRDVAHIRRASESMTNIGVPSEITRPVDSTFFFEEHLFLQPLMERSCEEDYFTKEMLSSLDYINV